jgi:hypothetical protein
MDMQSISQKLQDDIRKIMDVTNATNEAKKLAGPEVINATLLIPVVLIVAFAGLNMYMKNRKVAAS